MEKVSITAHVVFKVKLLFDIIIYRTVLVTMVV